MVLPAVCSSILNTLACGKPCVNRKICVSFQISFRSSTKLLFELGYLPRPWSNCFPFVILFNPSRSVYNFVLPHYPDQRMHSDLYSGVPIGMSSRRSFLLCKGTWKACFPNEKIATWRRNAWVYYHSSYFCQFVQVQRELPVTNRVSSMSSSGQSIPLHKLFQELYSNHFNRLC